MRRREKVGGIARQHTELISKIYVKTQSIKLQEKPRSRITRIFVGPNPTTSPPFSLPAYQELPWLLRSKDALFFLQVCARFSAPFVESRLFKFWARLRTFPPQRKRFASKQKRRWISVRKGRFDRGRGGK